MVGACLPPVAGAVDDVHHLALAAAQVKRRRALLFL
jgi:hypothetical protein